MDWQGLWLSVELATATALILLPLGVLVGRWLATSRQRLKPLAEATLALPLVLPPTVLGYYLLVAMGGASPLGQLYRIFSATPWPFLLPACWWPASSSTFPSR